DGFPLDRDPELKSHQVRIDQFLRIASVGVEQYRDAKPTPSLLVFGPEANSALITMADSMVEEFASDLVALHRACIRRFDWIRQHSDQFAASTQEGWRQALYELDCQGGLVQRCLQRVGSMPLESVIDGLLFGGGYKAFELAQKYVEAHGWTPKLVE